MGPKRITEEEYEEIMGHDRQVNSLSKFNEFAKKEIYELGIEIQRMDYLIDKHNIEFKDYKEDSLIKFSGFDEKINELKQNLDGKVTDLEQKLNKDIDMTIGRVNETQLLCENISGSIIELRSLLNNNIQELYENFQLEISDIKTDATNRYESVKADIADLNSAYKKKFRRYDITLGVIAAILSLAILAVFIL